MRMRYLGAFAVALAAALPLAACGGSSSSTAAASSNEPVEGEITVLTQRTDLVDTVFKKYAEEFHAKYPGATVKFEGITNYENDVKIRLNTDDYGDVLVIPGTVKPAELSQFFVPLGTYDSLKTKYRFLKENAYYDGSVYGLAITGNATGFAYNKKVWKAAGISTLPTTPEEFLADLGKIKQTSKAVPLYTNYAAGWTLTQWESYVGAVSGDADAVNKLTQTDAPWAAGSELNTIDSLLYNAVKSGYTEKDPTTTDWETSKKQIGAGQIATMAMGSWAITQFQEKAADPADIGYMPFPAQVNGQFHSVISGDYKQAVSVHSKHKAAALAWVTWFADESGYAADQGGVPPLLTGTFPSSLGDLTAAKVKYVELNPAPAGKESLFSDIDGESEIGLWQAPYRQEIVDAARGAKSETLQQIFDKLDKKWATARADVG